MSNEAAERLRLWIRAGAPADIVNAALAAERKATVERIRAGIVGHVISAVKRGAVGERLRILAILGRGGER